MSSFLTIAGLMVAIIAATVLNKKWPNIPLAIYQIAAGLALCLIPFDFSFHFEPELFITCLIAPLLFNEAQVISRHELWQLRQPVLLMAFGLVFATVGIGGLLINAFLPDMPTAVCFALAAILSPTDTVAVASITKNLKLPGHLHAIQEGESLMNDASGVVAFKVAVAAALTGVFSPAAALGNFLFTALGGILLGIILGYGIVRLRLFLRSHALDEIPMLVVIQLLTPIFIYLLCEMAQVSGILAVVAAGLIHSIACDKLEKTTTRLQLVTDNTWSVLSYVLNGLVFVLLGFLLPNVCRTLWQEAYFPAITAAALVITAILFAVRLIWTYLWYPKFEAPPHDLLSYIIPAQPAQPAASRLRYAVIAATCGIHGTFTLATALSLPYFMPDGSPFPMRDTVLALASEVILLSLLIASICLPRLLREPASSASAPTLSVSDAYCWILEQTLERMQSEKSPAAQPIIEELLAQLAAAENHTLTAIDQTVLADLFHQANIAAYQEAAELAAKEQFSPTLLDGYQLFLAHSFSRVEHSWRKKLHVYRYIHQLKRVLADAEKRARFQQALSVHQDQITAFHQLLSAGRQAAVQKLQQLTTAANRREALHIIQYFNQYTAFWAAASGKDAAFAAAQQSVRLTANQYKRDALQTLLEQNQISAKTLKDIQQALLYDEMVLTNT